MPSKYQPQVSAWREDLHKWVYTTKLHLSNNKKLRYANDDYCEFSRRPNGIGVILRVFLIIISFLSLLLTIFGVFVNFYGINIMHLRRIDILFVFLGIILIFISFVVLQIFLTILFMPEDCPIRLNRRTGKVYLYEHFILYLGSWATFTRSPFRAKEISVKEFNWADIQGCMTSVSVPLASGGMVRSYRLECVVCEPNTTKVIDYFLLTADTSLSYDEWMWINNYMAFYDNNLDAELMPEEDFTWPIKVNWPEEIDKKSKASSLEAYQQIDAEYKKIKE
ncbi:DUF6708 domain-containing protein [Gilliamella sp. ESL0250]|uniref:DUF6708 domain-containing protein n=1 Tax=Gilliamella sp. ESL0250 TaxID=2705036 RepID=UPI0015807F1F|nr:DUF6708 domain-containing protein [Gilliamella sp. ESL0250]NUF50716.1 hypothetical protein [Gilliamella sp. ESL0250]